MGAALVAALPQQFRCAMRYEGAHQGRPYATSILVEALGATIVVALFGQ